MYRNIISVVSYRWSVTGREEQRMKMFQNIVLRKITGLKREEVTRGYRKLHSARQERQNGRVIGHVWGRAEIHTDFWLGNLIERTHLEDLGIVGKILYKCILLEM